MNVFTRLIELTMSTEHGNKGNQYAVKSETGEQRTSTIHFRTLRSNKAAWVKTAQSQKMTLTQWIERTLNEKLD